MLDQVLNDTVCALEKFSLVGNIKVNYRVMDTIINACFTKRQETPKIIVVIYSSRRVDAEFGS